MRLLVINANTSQTVTDIVAAAARAPAEPGTEIVAVTGRFGARVIGTRTENAIAAHAALRELLPVPVVGMTEAAVIAAGRVAARFGLITSSRARSPSSWR